MLDTLYIVLPEILHCNDIYKVMVSYAKQCSKFSFELSNLN